jgi:hypothetical protein
MRQRHPVFSDKLLPTDNRQQALCACEMLGFTDRYSMQHGLLLCKPEAYIVITLSDKYSTVCHVESQSVQNKHTHTPSQSLPRTKPWALKVLLNVAPNNVTSTVLRCSAMWFEHSFAIYFQCINKFSTFKCVSPPSVTDRDSNHISDE